MKSAASELIFLCVFAAFAIAGDFKTKVITNSTVSIDVADHHFLRIYNFTQEGTATTRGVVIASAATPTATPTPTSTPTPTPTPTCSPSPCTPTPSPTPTPTPPPRAVLTAAMINSGSPPEFIKQVVIDGPAQVTINPVPSATLVLTYKKELEPTPTPVFVTIATPTPTPTPSPVAATIIGTTFLSEDVQDTAAGTPTPAPTLRRSTTPVPTPTPTPTPTPSPSLSPSSIPPTPTP